MRPRKGPPTIWQQRTVAGRFRLPISRVGLGNRSGAKRVLFDAARCPVCGEPVRLNRSTYQKNEECPLPRKVSIVSTTASVSRPTGRLLKTAETLQKRFWHRRRKSTNKETALVAIYRCSKLCYFWFSRTFDDSGPQTSAACLVFPGIPAHCDLERHRHHQKCGRT